MTIAVTDARFQSFGIVKTSSIATGVRATNNFADPTACVQVQAVTFQALSNGTGVVYICNTETPTLTDGVQGGVLLEVPPPSSSPVTRPMVALGNPTGTAPINVAELYVLPTVSGEGVRVTGMR